MSDSTLGWSAAVIEAAPDAIVVSDPEGRIVLVNAQTERLFGYPRDELLGKQVEVLVPEALRGRHPAHRARYRGDPQPRPMGAGLQLSARRKDGSEFPAEISLSAFDTGAGLHVAAAVRDASERLAAQAERDRLAAEATRERYESQLHQSQRLESLGQLAGGVAHDFNNLLAVIVNYAAFVAEEVGRAAAAGDRAWQTVARDVEQIQVAAQRATALTHQLLAFGRREVLRPSVLDINDVVRELERLLRRTLGEHVEPVIILADDLQPVFVDRGQLDQVLVNLAVNARDAMPAGGTLTIDTANTLVDAEYAARNPGLSPGSYVRLRVSDTGVGMPVDVRQRAFEPFFTTKAKGEGSGLGLATVYGIITQAKGWIQIYSEPGLGTAVTMLLPVTDQAPRRAPEPSPGTASAHRGETVLVVEDEEALREVARRILAGEGYQVLAAADGHQAIEVARASQTPIHLLLTDVVMPQMLGKEVAERIRAFSPGTRVLFMSGYAQPVLATQGTLDDGVTLLEKPFTVASLLQKVRQVLDAPQPG